MIPIVCTEQIAKGLADFYKGYFLTHHIKTKAGGFDRFLEEFYPTQEYIILGRHLDLFCKALSRPGPYHLDFGTSSEHQITVHNPFEKTRDSSYIGRKNQERLLQPYREHLRGLAFVKIGGNVESALAREVEAQLWSAPVPEPQGIINDLLRQKALGTRHYKAKKTELSFDVWVLAVIETEEFCKSSVYPPQVVSEGGKEFTDQLAEVLFALNMNLARNAISKIRKLLADT